MARADGSVIIGAEIDDKEAQAKLDKLKEEIDGLSSGLKKKNEEINAAVKKRDKLLEAVRKKEAAYNAAKEKTQLAMGEKLPLTSEIEETRKKMAEASAEAEQHRQEWIRGIVGADRDQSAAEGRLSALKQKLSDLEANAKKYDAAISRAAQAESVAKNELEEIENAATNAKNNVLKLQEDADKMAENLEKAKDEAGGCAKRLSRAKDETREISLAAEAASKRMDQLTNRIKALARRVLVFSLITKALNSLKNYMWEAIKTNEDAMASIAKLKGALMTLAQPIVNAVIPAFTVLVDVITRVVNAISRLLSMLFGTTAEESAKAAENLYNQKKALDGVGSAAKKAGKSLASFDEINKLSANESSGGGSGGGSSSGQIVPDFKSVVSDSLSAILELFTGAVLLSLGAILAFSGANVPLGLSLMALGALAMWDAVSTNWDVINNLLQGAIGDAVAITSTVLLAFGALLAFSGANIPLGIGMILAGAIGLAAVVAANWDTMQDTIAESIGKVLTVIGAGLMVIGAILAFSGANVALGIGMMVAGAAVLAVGSVALNWDAITSNVQTAIGKILQIAGASLLVLGLLFVITGVSFPLGLGLMAAGGAALGVGTAILNWDAIREKFSEVLNSIKQWWNSNCAKYFTKEHWANLGQRIIDGLLSGLKSAFEAVKTWVSNAVDWVKSQFTGAKSAASVTPNGFNSASGNSQQANFPIIQSIPALARGAVIPPNREFLAVLGDQRSGNNYEVPDAKLRQLLREELSALGGKNEAVLVLDRDVLGRVVYQLNKAEGNRIGVSLTGV